MCRRKRDIKLHTTGTKYRKIGRKSTTRRRLEVCLVGIRSTRHREFEVQFEELIIL